MTKPGAVLQHAHPWRREESHLRGQLARLLATIIKFFGELRIEEHYGIAHRGAVFRPAKAEHINACLPCDFLRRDAERGDRVGETRAVHVHAEAMLFRDSPDSFDFGNAVDSPELGRLREADDARLGVMNVISLCRHAFDTGWIHLAVL